MFTVYYTENLSSDLGSIRYIYNEAVRFSSHPTRIAMGVGSLLLSVIIVNFLEVCPWSWREAVVGWLLIGVWFGFEII